jgi:hypothetical protein
MANIIGEGFNDYVRKQINHRQEIHGKKENRSIKEISYLNAKTAWVKVASSVSISSKKNELTELRLKKLDISGIGPGIDLAKNFVLFNGTSRLQGKILTQKSGLAKDNSSNVVNNSAYGIGGLNFGQQPMPGIIDLSVQSINRGSLRKATLTVKAYNSDQLKIIDLLYLRLGYTLLVEYGNSHYINGKGKVQPMGSTLVEEKFFGNKLEQKSYSALLPEIEKKRYEYSGNYDGFFGRITNFSWNFNADGSYDIKIHLYSIGDVIESLKLNQINTTNLLKRFQEKGKTLQIALSKQLGDASVAETEEKLKNKLRSKNKLFTYLDDIRKFYDYSQNPVTFTYEEAEVINEARFKELSKTIEENYLNQNSDKTGFVNRELAQIGQNYDKSLKYENLENEINIDQVNKQIKENTSENIKAITNPIGQASLSGTGGLLKRPEEIINGSTEGSFIEKENNRYWNSEHFSLKLKHYTNNFLLSKEYIIQKYPGKPTSNLETAKIPYYANANFTSFSFAEVGSFNKYTFNPAEPLVNISPKFASGFNMPPYPSLADRKIANENSTKIKQKQQEINLKGGNELDSYESENYVGESSFGSEVSFTKKTGKGNVMPNTMPLGVIINRLDGWVGQDLYNTKAIYADHFHCDKYNPTNNKFFIRLGTLLGFINSRVLYKVRNEDDNTDVPLFRIDTDIESNIMYTLPNHYSLDPSIAITNVKVKGIKSTMQTFDGLEEFQNTSPYYGKIMNIYLSHSFVEQEMTANTDQNNSLVLFDFINAICQRLNIVFGGINNLHPSIDETTNCIKIYDDTPIPNIENISSALKETNPAKYGFLDSEKKVQWGCNTLPDTTIDYSLLLYGYNEYTKESNFVNNISVKTEVTKDMATMLSIGATSAGYVVGEESTAFSKWNYGIKDRYYQKYLDAESKSEKEAKRKIAEDQTEANNEVKRAYASNMFNNFESSQPAYYLGVSVSYDEEEKTNDDGTTVTETKTTISPGGGIHLPESMQENINSGTEFYRYLISSASVASTSTKPIGSPQGFLPISMELDLDGISGIKIYQKVVVDNSFLPNNYPDNMDFIVKGLSHSIMGNHWKTSLSTLATSQLSGETVVIENFEYDVKDLERAFRPSLAESNPHKGSTIVGNFKTNTYPLIVRDKAQIDRYKKEYGHLLGDDFNNFKIRKGLNNPKSYVTEFGNFLEKKQTSSSNTRIVIKGGKGNDESNENQLGNGADISKVLFNALKKFWNVLGKEEYKKYYPIVIVGGNDAFHHGPTLTPKSPYPTANVLPINTTHTRGLAIDIRQADPRSSTANSERNKLLQKALLISGFTGIKWHDPPHIHANVSVMPPTFNSQYSNYNQQSVSFSSF